MLREYAVPNMLLLFICPTGAQQMCITFITIIIQVHMLPDEIQRGTYISLLLVIRAEQTVQEETLTFYSSL